MRFLLSIKDVFALLVVVKRSFTCLFQFSGGGRGASDSESESEESEVEVDFEDDLEYLRSLDPKETQDQDHYKVEFIFQAGLGW